MQLKVYGFCSLFFFFAIKEQSISEDIGAGEASDALSALSNEECSIASEILDKNCHAITDSIVSHSHINAAEIIQVSFFFCYFSFYPFIVFVLSRGGGDFSFQIGNEFY